MFEMCMFRQVLTLERKVSLPKRLGFVHSAELSSVALVGKCGRVAAELEIFLWLKARRELQLLLLESWNV